MAKGFKYDKALVVALGEALRRVFGDEWFTTTEALRSAFRSDELASVVKLVLATVQGGIKVKGESHRVSAYIRRINKIDCDLWCERKEAYPDSGNNVLAYRIIKRSDRHQAKPAEKPAIAPAVVSDPATAQDPASVVVHAINRAAEAIIVSQERCATRIIDAIVDEFRSAWAPAKRNG